MLQDVLNRRTTEIDDINGVIVALAIEHDISVPVQQTITRLIRSMEIKE